MRLAASLIPSAVLLFVLSDSLPADEGPPVSALSLYASFDEKVAADLGGGELTLRTRSDHPETKGKYVFRAGFPERAFGIKAGQGVSKGALECRDVLPRRGRIFFPLQGNLAYKEGGWGGAVSLWINTNPNTELKTPFCDPVQITQKGAHDGGLWLDFPDKKPRDMRMGIFRGLGPGETPLKESDPKASIVTLERVGFETGQWHHLALSWKNFDTGKPDAHAQFFVDGKLVGEVKDRDLAMGWDPEQAGIYVAVNFIGLMDEFATFNRPLTASEVKFLYANPDYLNENARKP